MKFEGYIQFDKEPDLKLLNKLKSLGFKHLDPHALFPKWYFFTYEKPGYFKIDAQALFNLNIDATLVARLVRQNGTTLMQRIYIASQTEVLEPTTKPISVPVPSIQEFVKDAFKKEVRT